MNASNSHRIEQLETWMTSVEGENFEFKEAKNRFSFEELAKYACALANEGGGRIILGVTDKRLPGRKAAIHARKDWTGRHTKHFCSSTFGIIPVMV